MSYQQALGVDILGLASQVAQDPCLYEVTELVKRLVALGGHEEALGAVTPTRGVGLCRAVKPLKVAIYLRQNKWVLPVAGLALVGGIFAAGYFTGKSRRGK